MRNGTEYHPGLHRFALFLSFAVFLLIVAGALVTSNDAGLAVPDWPTSFGSFYKIPPVVGGVKYEHGHRMLAQFVGLLTIILAVWAQRVDGRRRVRILAWSAVGLVIVQGVLGGLGVLKMLPWYISTAHAALAQTFFSVAVILAMVTGRRWLGTAPLESAEVSRLRVPCLAALAAVYAQLYLGAAFRHGGMHFLPHLIGAGVATVILLWLVVTAFTRAASVKPIRGAAIAILALLVMQLALGFAAYLTRVRWGQNAVQPEPAMVATTVAHVAVGALLLAHVFMITLAIYRHGSSATASAARRQDVVTA